MAVGAPPESIDHRGYLRGEGRRSPPSLCTCPRDAAASHGAPRCPAAPHRVQIIPTPTLHHSCGRDNKYFGRERRQEMGRLASTWPSADELGVGTSPPGQVATTLTASGLQARRPDSLTDRLPADTEFDISGTSLESQWQSYSLSFVFFITGKVGRMSPLHQLPTGGYLSKHTPSVIVVEPVSGNELLATNQKGLSALLL